MRVLLDSHAFVWWDHSPGKLSSRARSTIESNNNEIFVSVASLWELQIKRLRGKLEFPRTLGEMLRAHQERNAFRLLGVTPAHVWALEATTMRQGDPFDRMILAQAKAEAMELVSCDRAMHGYGVEIVW